MFTKLTLGQRVLILSALIVLLISAAACAPAPTPAPTAAPPTAAPKPTDAPKATEAPKPAATTAPQATVAPTTAPASGISDADLAKEAGFFKGKTANFVVPYATGAGYDTWVRLIAPFMNKYTGATWVVKNQEGAGGILGTNQIYVADPNGLTIGIVNGVGVVQAQLTDTAGVQYDLAKFSYVGRLTTDPRVLTVSAKGKYKSIDDMRKATDKVKIGAPGPGSSNFVEAVLIFSALGIKLDMITGYGNSEEADLAVVRGDIDGQAGSYASKLAMIKSGDLLPVLQYGKGKIADLPTVQMLTEVPNVNDEGKALIATTLALGESGRPIVAPPGVSAARLKFLENALKKSLEDPELLALTSKQKMEVIYLSSADTAALIKGGISMAPEQKKKLQDLIKQYTPTK